MTQNQHHHSEPSRGWGTFKEAELHHIQKALSDKIPPEGVSYRSSGGGQVAYLEGWRAFNYANDIFGFNGWSSEILNFTIDFIDVDNGRVSAGISCTVRIILKDGTYHDDIGYGASENVRGKGAALDKARKEAVTDATKRALRLFGNHLGNCCYDKEYLRDIKSGSYNKNNYANRPVPTSNAHMTNRPAPIPINVAPVPVPVTKPELIMTEEDLFHGNDMNDIPMQPIEPPRPFAPLQAAAAPMRPSASPIRATTFQPAQWQPMPHQPEFKPFNPQANHNNNAPSNEFVKWNPANIGNHK